MEFKNYNTDVANETETQAFGKRLASKLPSIITVFLRGELGAGKTTLVRSVICAMQPSQVVKSPTFTLVEPYAIGAKMIYHFDLYRMNNPQEIEFIGANDYFGTGISFVEWPEKGDHFLPQPDVDCSLEVFENARHITLRAKTALGEKLIQSLKKGDRE